jgi:hypothetical protein
MRARVRVREQATLAPWARRAAARGSSKNAAAASAVAGRLRRAQSEALEACALPDDEWRAVEPLALETIGDRDRKAYLEKDKDLAP